MKTLFLSRWTKKRGPVSFRAKFAVNSFKRPSTVSNEPIIRFHFIIYNHKLTLFFLDLSAGVDVYADWIDACDAVAQDAAEAATAEQSGHSYRTLAGDHGRHSQFQSDRHLVSSLEADEYSQDYDDS